MYREGDSQVESESAEVGSERGSARTHVSEVGRGTPTHKPNGQFAKGNQLGKRHSPAVDQRAYIAALAAGFPPERLLELMETAIRIAIETKSWRGVVAASEFAANYTLGKPKQRIESTGAVSIGDMLAGLDTSAPLLPGEDAGEGT